jgi:hypothetical protein
LAQIFPQWTNKLPIILIFIITGTLLAVVGFFWYFGSPKYTDVGYRPRQPVPYSHKLHAGDLSLDCRYCHNFVEVSAKANIPPTQTCMNCHTLIKTDSEKLTAVRESWSSNKPIEWVRVHKLPDYVFFNHSIHLRAGIGCQSCHGTVTEMEEIMQVEPLSMGWCLTCHRSPDMHLRAVSDITSMKWIPAADQLEFARKAKQEKNIAPPVECSGCHR